MSTPFSWLWVGPHGGDRVGIGRSDVGEDQTVDPGPCHLEPCRVLGVEEVVVPPLVGGAEEWGSVDVCGVGRGEELVAPAGVPTTR